MMRYPVAAVAVIVVGGACAPALPAEDVLHLQGTVEGPGGPANLDFSDTRSKGEWWPCDARFTAQACVADGEKNFHVNVFVARPEITEVKDLGGDACVVDGEPQGAFEVLRAGAGRPFVVGEDVSAFVLVASDEDGNGAASLDDDAETLAVAAVESGSIETSRLQNFDDVFAFRLTGKADGNDVVVEFHGATANPLVVPGLEPAGSCVE